MTYQQHLTVSPASGNIQLLGSLDFLLPYWFSLFVSFAASSSSPQGGPGHTRTQSVYFCYLLHLSEHFCLN